MSDNYTRMIQLVTEFFDVKNDPDQLDVNEAILARLQETAFLADELSKRKMRAAGIIVNRWGHAYVNPQPGFFFGVGDRPAPREVLRQAPFGRIAFANTDLAGAMDHRNAIAEARRAVHQIGAL